MMKVNEHVYARMDHFYWACLKVFQFIPRIQVLKPSVTFLSKVQEISWPKPFRGVMIGLKLCAA